MSTAETNSDTSDNGSKGRSISLVLLSFFVIAAVGYFGFFGVILLDEIVVGTSYVSSTLPQSCLHFLEVVYAPLIMLVEWAGIVE